MPGSIRPRAKLILSWVGLLAVFALCLVVWRPLPRVLKDSSSGLHTVQSLYTDASIRALAASSTAAILPNWKPLLSNARGVPYVVTADRSDPAKNTLYVYDAAQKITRRADTNIRQFGGLSNCGDQDPLPSPDLRYTLYIDHNNNVTLLSNDTLEKKVLYQPPWTYATMYLTAWSPNSERVVFCQHEESNDFGPSGPEPVPTAYFVFDRSTGRLQTLLTGDMLIGFSDFIDNDHLLTFVTAPNPTQPDETDLTALNVSTLTINRSLYERAVAPTIDRTTFDPQRSYSDGHTTMAYITAIMGSENYQTPPPGLKEGGESILRIFDVARGTTRLLKQGFFAQYQWPLISPNATKIAYEERSVGKPASSDYRLWMYDAATDQHSVLFEGSAHALQWIDNDRLLFVSYDTEANSRYHVLTLSSGSVVDLP